jgi:hypothetical protein
VCKPTPTAKAGGIMMFAVKKEKCMGCKTLISEKDKVSLAYSESLFFFFSNCYCLLF